MSIASSSISVPIKNPFGDNFDKICSECPPSPQVASRYFPAGFISKSDKTSLDKTGTCFNVVWGAIVKLNHYLVC